MGDNAELKDKTDDTVLATTVFDGTLSFEDHTASVEFVAHAGRACRLLIEPIKVEAKTFMALQSATGRPGQHKRSVSLTGQSGDGKSFRSDDMSVGSSRHNSDGFLVELKTGEAAVTLPRKDKDRGLGLKFALRGFKSFRANPVECALGRVVVSGQSKVHSSDDVTGEIVVVKTSDIEDPNWFERAGELAQFIWKGIQFGHGGRLHMPLEQVFEGETVTATFFNGAGRPRHLPAIHHMDQSAFISALVSRFEDPDEFPEAVWQVVGWLNNDSSIDEVRFLTLMTAIETIVDNLVPDAQSTLIPKAQYLSIREKLIETLAECELSGPDLEILSNKIKGLNTAPISQKMNALIDKYGLPENIFDAGLMKRLNKQRVSIVHKGFALKDDNLWECLLYAREMVARIVFAELKYDGRFESYAGQEPSQASEPAERN